MMFPVAVGGAGPAISFTIPSRRSSKHEIKRRGERAGTWRRRDVADGCLLGVKSWRRDGTDLSAPALDGNGCH